jgi:exodeoxyribonuclease-3
MKLYSWNVNGIRAVIKRGFADFLNAHQPDVLCLQETKIDDAEARKIIFDGNYEVHWYGAVKKGYSGTALLTKVKPLSVSFGLDMAEHDQEGRVITAEFAHFNLVTVYTPNSQRGLARLAYRTEEWDTAFLAHLKKLEKKKPVIFCGDLNVAHQEIDLANPKQNTKNAGFTPEERKSFDHLLKQGFTDTFRMFEKGGGHYTWWSAMNNARERNIGWRIDYFCVSQKLESKVKSARIHPEVMGSDHCPISLEVKI